MGMFPPPHFPKSLVTETWVCERREEGLSNYRAIFIYFGQEDLFKNNKKLTSIELT